MFLIEEFFPLGGLDVQLEIWEGRLSVPVQCCIAQQICEVRPGREDLRVLDREALLTYRVT
jgi:hypothetical protein